MNVDRSGAGNVMAFRHIFFNELIVNFKRKHQPRRRTADLFRVNVNRRVGADVIIGHERHPKADLVWMVRERLQPELDLPPLPLADKRDADAVSLFFFRM